MTYATESKKNSLEKNTLAWLEPSERVVLWTLHSGAVYKRSTDYYVIDLKVDSTSYTEASSTTLSASEWYFDASAKMLYMRMSDDSNPQNSFVTLTYRIFFAKKPIKLPYNLVDGDFEVDYDFCLNSIPQFSHGLDPQDQSGISLESGGTIQFRNNDFWKAKFDKLFWENKRIVLYSHLKQTNDTKKMFEGEITDKAYSSTLISFRAKDFVHKLNSLITADLFSSADGNISDAVIGKPKRTIYGKVDGLQIQSLDQTLDGYSLTGTISGSAASLTVTGSGTAFLSECSGGDDLIYEVNSEKYTFKIYSVVSDTEITLSEENSVDYSGVSALLLPTIPYRGKNRTFSVSGHKLRSPSTTISSVVDTNKIIVADASDMFVNDVIVINSTLTRIIKRISGNNITTTQVFSASAGQTVVKKPISKAYFNGLELIVERDWTITNTTECKLILNNLAEFNQTKLKVMTGTIAINNGSRSVVGTGTTFTTSLNVRDWIRTNDSNHTTWYEVLNITDDLNLEIRVAYAGVNHSGPGEKKNVKYIEDESIVTVDTIGKENSSGVWVKTASDAIKDILTNAEITNIDTDSFTNSKEDAPYILALKLPLERTNGLPTAKAVVNLINKSVFGSLVARSDYTVAFDVLNADRPQEAENIIIDADKLSYSVKTKSQIIANAVCKYNHQDADKYTHESAYAVESYTNEFVENVIGTTKGEEFDIYLYNSADAQTIAQRIVYFRSLTQSVVSLKGGGLFLADKQINDKVYFSFSHLYERYGAQGDGSKVGIINKIGQDGDVVNIDISDLGNIYNRTAAIAPNDASDFSAANERELILNGYIVDNSTELPGATEDEIQTNLIG